TVVLTEKAGKTTLKLTLLYPSKEARDGTIASGMERGVAASYDRLAELLASTPASRLTATQKITPFLWFNGQAEEAARFSVSLFPDSRTNRVTRSPADTPSGPAGMVLTVEFTLAGTRFVGLNGGPQFPFTEAVSFHIACTDQAEVDRLWATLSDGGS